ncbi:ethylene-responsive transcription factor ERF017-like [Actinidia eriantha]|uniref:ethylene-responsive transcription factor ERF017-like n=1 Tax=Actinidia eriantha TaxID=165200 RepID=UPI002588B67D|nr:ethylene-responsive transcription factor ERF017-like [Actinidia eriantha]
MVKPETSKQAERSTSDESKYKGVRKRKWGKWVSEIRLPNSRERIWLGSYKSAEKAARAFDAALFCLRGPSAKFNFPENPPEIAGGRSLTPAEIQVAAARFANAEPQTSRSRRSSSSSSSSSSSEMQVESPSPSVSDGVAPMGTETPLDGSFLNLFATMGSENTGPGSFDIFPGFDDFSNEFFVPPLPNVDYGEENCDGNFSQGSFLWNF